MTMTSQPEAAPSLVRRAFSTHLGDVASIDGVRLDTDG